MPCRLTLAQLSEILAATPQNFPNSMRSSLTGGVSTDTRSLQPGDVFVALRGQSFDGHKFAATAAERGAMAIVAENGSSVELPDGIPLLRVADTLQAYQAIARWWRDNFAIPIIGVTGSVGKTTTKELIAAVLATQGKVLKTEANYNNEIGVPKTLLQLGSEHDFAVIEMAMRARGEIALLSQIARPTIGVITNVGTAHIGRLGSEEAIAQAKCELLAEMPSNSIAILNCDNSLLMETAATVWQEKTIAYGLSGGDLHGELIDAKTIKVDGWELPLPLPGRHNALNYLAALAVAKVLGIDFSNFTSGLTVELPEGRAKRYVLPDDIVILDETYNAGLESMLAALHLLAETPGKRHIAVLGTMKELGDRSPEFHRQVGVMARQLNLDALLVLTDDPEAKAIAAGAAGMNVECFSTHAEIAEGLQELAQPGDRILFKASHSVGLDKAIDRFRELVVNSR